MTEDVTPVFVVGSGRCGSTLLSHMLREHSTLLSLSEVIVALSPDAFPRGDVSAGELWAMLTRPRVKTTLMLRHGLEVDEFLYPFDGGGRFDRSTGVPPLSLTALPFVSNDPDGLLDALEVFVASLDAAPIGHQYALVFGWLARHLGRERWVERSGSSLRFVPRLIACFDDARFVHLHRDGRACAYSMSRHHNFRLGMIGAQQASLLGYDPYHTSARVAVAHLPEPLASLLPETFDVSVYDATTVPTSLFGKMWSAQISVGCGALATLEPGRVLTIAYEDLIARPRRELARVANFIGVAANDDWLERAAALCRPDSSGWRELPEDERLKLDRSCTLGMRLLGRISRTG